MTDLISISITEAVKGLKDKKFSATELVGAHLKQVDACDHLNAFISKSPEVGIETSGRNRCAYRKG